jgi:sugar phosphate isomerase/epimerase
MKLAISNIAWPIEADTWVARVLADEGIEGVEVAPTKMWPDPTAASDDAIDEVRNFWSARSLEIVAAQALLYGRPDLTLFTDEATREATLTYLDGIFRVCGRLGATPLVFGSPRNRAIGDLEPRAAWPIARDFFARAAESASHHGVVLCVEPNPPEYGCDFVTSAEDAAKLCALVDHPAFGIHLDTAAMTLAGEDPRHALEVCGPFVRHLHASEPFLARFGTTGVDHETMAALLRERAYQGWVSVEMRHDPDHFGEVEMRRVCALLRHTYG